MSEPVRVTKSVGHQDGAAERRKSTNRGVLLQNLHGGPTMRLAKEEKPMEANPIDPSQGGGSVTTASVTTARKLRDMVPPPEERLCHRHRIPIAPSRWKSGHRHSDCSRCRNEHPSKKRNNLNRSMAKSLRDRRRYLAGPNSMTVLQMFNRITGFNIQADEPLGEK
jgi:hypothetical protein